MKKRISTLNEYINESEDFVKEIKQYAKKFDFVFSEQGGRGGKTTNLGFHSDLHSDNRGNAGVEDVLRAVELKKKLEKKFKEIKDIDVSIERQWVNISIKIK